MVKQKRSRRYDPTPPDAFTSAAIDAGWKVRIYDCTPEEPYGGEAFERWAAAHVTYERGQVSLTSVRHDGRKGEACPNCGQVTR